MVGPVGTSNLGSWNSHWMVVLNIFTSYFQVYNFLSTILANNPLLFPCDIPILSWFLLQSAFFRWFSVLKLDPHVHIWLYGFPWFSYGFPMIFWVSFAFYQGFPMVFCWFMLVAPVAIVVDVEIRGSCARWRDQRHPCDPDWRWAYESSFPKAVNYYPTITNNYRLLSN